MGTGRWRCGVRTEDAESAMVGSAAAESRRMKSTKLRCGPPERHGAKQPHSRAYRSTERHLSGPVAEPARDLFMGCLTCRLRLGSGVPQERALACCIPDVRVWFGYLELAGRDRMASRPSVSARTSSTSPQARSGSGVRRPQRRTRPSQGEGAGGCGHRADHRPGRGGPGCILVDGRADQGPNRNPPAERARSGPVRDDGQLVADQLTDGGQHRRGHAAGAGEPACQPGTARIEATPGALQAKQRNRELRAHPCDSSEQ